LSHFPLVVRNFLAADLLFSSYCSLALFSDPVIFSLPVPEFKILATRGARGAVLRRGPGPGFSPWFGFFTTVSFRSAVSGEWFGLIFLSSGVLRCGRSSRQYPTFLARALCVLPTVSRATDSSSDRILAFWCRWTWRSVWLRNHQPSSPRRGGGYTSSVVANAPLE